MSPDTTDLLVKAVTGVCAALCGVNIALTFSGYRTRPRVDAVCRALEVFYLISTPLVAVLLWVTGDPGSAVLWGGTWALSVLLLLFGGPKGRRRWQRLTSTIRDAGHRLVVTPTTAGAR